MKVEFLDPLRAILSSAGWETRAQEYSLEGDPAIKAYLVVLNVPTDRLLEVENLVYDQAISMWPDAHLPFVLLVATPEKTVILFPNELKFG